MARRKKKAAVRFAHQNICSDKSERGVYYANWPPCLDANDGRLPDEREELHQGAQERAEGEEEKGRQEGGEGRR